MSLSPQIQKIALKTSCILWIIWGLVHMFAGIMTISLETPADVAGIADAVDPTLLTGTYHEAVGAVINQHGFNLLWIGLTTTICAFYIWRGNFTAMFIAGLTGGLADVGYFVFMDLGGFVNFVPGTVMTLVSSLAVILTLSVWLSSRKSSA